jgi:hypothetical protein
LAVALSRTLNVAQSALALDDLIQAFQKNEKTLHLVARRALPENAVDLRLVTTRHSHDENQTGTLSATAAPCAAPF